MPKASVNGLNIHYIITGEGPDVVMIHGMTSNLAFWHLTVLSDLSKDFRITTYDLRGHGYSDSLPSGYTSADMAADLRGLLDCLEIEKAYLIGHSFGSVVALHSAALYPDRVAGLVLTDPEIPALRHLTSLENWPYFERWKQHISQFGITIPDDKWNDAEYMFRKALYAPMIYGLRKGQTRPTQRLLRLLDETTFLRDIQDMAGLTMEEISRVQQPTLALYGEMSPYLQSCRWLAEHMPNCRVAIVEGVGHFIPALQPKAFVAKVKEFLLNLSQPG